MIRDRTLSKVCSLGIRILVEGLTTFFYLTETLGLFSLLHKPETTNRETGRGTTGGILTSLFGPSFPPTQSNVELRGRCLVTPSPPSSPIEIVKKFLSSCKYFGCLGRTKRLICSSSRHFFFWFCLFVFMFVRGNSFHCLRV